MDHGAFIHQGLLEKLGLVSDQPASLISWHPDFSASRLSTFVWNLKSDIVMNTHERVREGIASKCMWEYMHYIMIMQDDTFASIA